MPAYTVREWDKLAYGDGEGQIRPTMPTGWRAWRRARSLLAAAAAGCSNMVGMPCALAAWSGFWPQAMRAWRYCPRSTSPGETPDHQNAAIRKRLVHMLAVALDLKIDLGVITDLAWQRETLLEILIRIFCDKLTTALRKGMPRRYVEREEDLPTLRGQLDITRQFTRHAVNPSRLACRFDLLSEDIALNRIMKAAVVRLLRVSRRNANQQRLRELAFVYADIADVPVSALRWDEVVIDRTNRSWQELFAMARLFLQDRYQTTTGGAGQGTAMLFEMNALFEEYVGRLIAGVGGNGAYRHVAGRAPVLPERPGQRARAVPDQARHLDPPGRCDHPRHRHQVGSGLPLALMTPSKECRRPTSIK